MIPLKSIENIIRNYETLEKELSSKEIVKKDIVNKSKEYSNIGEIIDHARSYLSFEKEKNECFRY